MLVPMHVVLRHAVSSKIKETRPNRGRNTNKLVGVIEKLLQRQGGGTLRSILKAGDKKTEWVHTPPGDIPNGAGSWQLFEHNYYRAAWLVHLHIVSQIWFEALVMACILAVAATTGIVLNGYDSNGMVSILVSVVTWITLVIFTLEPVLKIMACGPDPLHYFKAPNGDGAFNTADFILAILGLALFGSSNAAGVKVLRLVRLVRLLAFIKNVPVLKIILAGLISGMRSVGSIVALLFLVIYLFAIFGVQAFGANDPANFGTVLVSIMTLFQVSTLAGWTNVAATQWHGCSDIVGRYTDSEVREEIDTMTGSLPGWGCYDDSKQPLTTSVFFTAFTILTSMVIISLFLGVVMIGMVEAYEDTKNLKAALSYRQGLVDLKKNMLEEGSALCKTVDTAMMPNLTLADLQEPIAGSVYWRRLVEVCRRAESHLAFHVIVNSCIAIAGLVVGLTTDSRGDPRALWTVELVCQIVFTFELIIKMTTVELKMRRFFRNHWNKFDFVIVLNGWLEVGCFTLGGTKALRMLRLLRLLRAVRASPRLQSMVESLLEGFSAVGWVLVLLVICNYIFGCLGVMLFKDTDPFHYATVELAMFTTYTVETLDDWEHIYRACAYGCGEYPGYYPKTSGVDSLECKGGKGLGGVAAMYFIIVVICGGLIIPSMLVGIVALTFEERFRKTESERKTMVDSDRIISQVKAEMPSFFTSARLLQFRRVFDAMDVDKGGSLDLNEINPLLKYICRKHLQIEVTLEEMVEVFMLFDVDGSSDFIFGELVLVMMYLLKAKYALQSGATMGAGPTVDSANSSYSDRSISFAAEGTPDAEDIFIPGPSTFSSSKKSFMDKKTMLAMEQAAALDGLGAFEIESVEGSDHEGGSVDMNKSTQTSEHNELARRGSPSLDERRVCPPLSREKSIDPTMQRLQGIIERHTSLVAREQEKLRAEIDEKIKALSAVGEMAKSLQEVDNHVKASMKSNKGLVELTEGKNSIQPAIFQLLRDYDSYATRLMSWVQPETNTTVLNGTQEYNSRTGGVHV